MRVFRRVTKTGRGGHWETKIRVQQKRVRVPEEAVGWGDLNKETAGERARRRRRRRLLNGPISRIENLRLENAYRNNSSGRRTKWRNNK